MRGVRSWGMTAALIVGLGGAVAEAGPLDANPPPKGLLSGLFSDKSKTPSKTADKPKNAEDQPAPLPSVDNSAALRQRHMKAFLRRLSVCQRLHEVAQQTSNNALEDQANQLEARAYELYCQQTNGLSALPPSVLRKPQNIGEPNRVINTMGEVKPEPPQRMPRALNAPSLDGSMEGREQAILNGSSMGGLNR